MIVRSGPIIDNGKGDPMKENGRRRDDGGESCRIMGRSRGDCICPNQAGDWRNPLSNVVTAAFDASSEIKVGRVGPVELLKLISYRPALGSAK